MKQQIKHRYTNAVLFECDVPDDVSSGLQMRHALEKAVSARAYLADANLADANLAGAKFSDAKLLIGKRPYMAIGPIGSRCAMVTLWITDKGPMVKAGCFTGTLEEFSAAVTKTHGSNDHAKEYEMTILMFESHCSIWTPEVTA